MKNKILLVIVFILIISGAWWFNNKINRPTSLPSNNVAPKTITASDLSLQVEDLGTDEYSRPHQRVVLMIGGSTGTKQTIGEYFMNCSGKFAEETLVAGEIARKTCWWGGAGKLIVLVSENNTYVVKVQDLDEQSGSGKLKTVFEVK